MRNQTLDITLSAKQYHALTVLNDPSTEELMYGGAKGGGKSVFGCYWSYFTAKSIIKDFNIQRRKYPLVIGFMGRKQAIDFKATTLNTWKRYIPEQAYVIREIDGVKYIVIEEKVAIQIGGMDKIATINKFNSAEFAFFFIDQGEEITEDDISILRGTLRLKINGKALHYVGLITANPAICWLKNEFIDNPTPGNKFIRALPGDNPFLPAGYVDQLKKAFSFKPELLRAYLFGSWEDLEGANIVIPYRNVVQNVNNSQFDKSVIKRITVCDISGEGEDETVIYDLVNTRIVDQEIYSHRSTMDTCGRLQAHAVKNKSNLISVDIIGEGKGCYDRLVEIYADSRQLYIYGYDSRKQATDNLTFGNKRAEDWWHAAHMFAEKRCDIPNDPRLIRQLSGVTYRYQSNGKIYIDSKDVLRTNLRCSPDRADTYIMALAALKEAEPYSKPDAYMREEEEDYEFSPETC